MVKGEASLQTSVENIKGVGDRTQQQLARLGLFTLQDLLFHLPLRYQDRTQLTPLNKLSFGKEYLVEGIITSINFNKKNRRSVTCQITDSCGFLTLRFFHFSGHVQQQLKPQQKIRCFGEVRMGPQGWEMAHPEFMTEKTELSHCLTPVYPATEGLHQNKLRLCITQALNLLIQTPEQQVEILPEKIRHLLNLGSLTDALLNLHQPRSTSIPNLDRLAIEEFMAHHLSLLTLRAEIKKHQAAILKTQTNLITQFLKQLPFTLTHAQNRAFAEIEKDLSSNQPMLRLIQGDVGSGKTLVAALAALLAIDNQQQVAIMAPTEILAEQHWINFKKWFSPLTIQTLFLTGKIKGQKRAETLEKIASGTAQLIIGTHALFQETVTYKNLALIIIDEQHRFGVDQRLSLRNKGADTHRLPHQLMMTATPIPRTLSMTLYVDLDTSIIDELPPGRQPITTLVMPGEKREQLIQRIQQVCAQGRQVYWVCTLIEESDLLTAEAANSTCENLQHALPNLRIGLIHGQLKTQQKAEIMEAFKTGSIDLLVATTVIEVGVDVPNATLMVIENAERLGLAQLHQLRGRVGRGQEASYCILLYKNPLSLIGRQRLGYLKTSQDGFYLAEKDLELRGPGEILGTRQTGELSFRIAELIRDQALLPLAKQGAEILLKEFPEQAQALVQRWLRQQQSYLQV